MSARLDIPLAEPLAPRMAAAPAARPRGIALLASAVIATAALVALAAAAWLHGTRPAILPGPAGAWYAVQLQNGQMFYGVLRETGPTQVQLADVYYVQAFTQPDGRPGNRVVSRQKNDWHGPGVLTIPADRIVTIEAVGPESQLARLIAQDQGRAAR
ncbi:hypothetical protein GJV26_18050 [Massilia dura]|uniref:Uncharacterized protein n=1 Tax=Pseudoduganella dura TaxID=321982 RepID=A0A6I3XCV0_9BURK|nr:hypothetical protein [Pseudoduganella dura]MUI14349.1 hypothetical protein [Pseudoduganella dura]GGY20670.1 hypothetical protein GCM10007386_57100 [Pseudoduganella dura]